MQADYEKLDTLLQIQAIDMSLIQARKARAELPQRIEVVKVRKKRDEIAPKLERVKEMQAAKEAQVTEVEDEDRILREKHERIQEEIDEAGSDYRAVEARSRDMAGIAKRRVSLEEQLSQLRAELGKIQEVRAQVEDAIALCERREAELRGSYEAEDDEIVARMRKLMAKRGELAGGVSADLMKLYDKTAARTGGVALGRLEEGRCGVCRAALEGGRLIELKAQAPLGTCPNCKRLLIVE